jgi:hypothetical protein
VDRVVRNTDADTVWLPEMEAVVDTVRESETCREKELDVLRMSSDGERELDIVALSLDDVIELVAAPL